ncbi:hypothetical protein [Vallitalea guaymasensis]|uniref:RadC-like JAB domain-containing protein n=1 Tax=Vallitalea guaymasensis TaxID=1185412 RepID=A0A8J8M7I6_9FIRM|nr:hypothetical protein [Vallitalea guaymasensis]QUH27570.1 hypothetical protein HYG85_01005 [Vallitalea guaymasensis]
MLNDSEVKILAKGRQVVFHNSYYDYNKQECSVDRKFKSSLKPTGKIYTINESLYDIPTIAAALLKYKKHEWVIIALESNKKLPYLYVNKGYDNSSVSLFWGYDEIVEFCKKNNVTTVLQFHNHPNSNPNYYDCTKPSQQDILSANEFSKILTHGNINLIEYVCERGFPYKYYFNYNDNIKKLSEFCDEITTINGTSKSQNYKLHKELRQLSRVSYI